MTKFLNISTDNTLGGSSPSDETVSSQKAVKEYVDNNTAPAGNYVTTDTIQSINQSATKTFNGRVNFYGTGDSNAIYLSTDTRIDVKNTSNTVLGFANGTFLINHNNYGLMLRGSGDRPNYKNSTTYLALLSDVPTVNNPTITFTQGGTTKGTITLNQSGDQTIEFDAGGSGGGAVDSVNGQTGTVVLDAEDVGALPDTTVIPTDTADLTNGAGFITSSALSGYATETWVGQQGYLTGITSSDVTTALGYTPYNSTNPSGYQANVIETVKVNGTALTPSSKAVDITVPTNNNQLTNGAGYITSSALSGYQTTITGGATTITSSNLTTSRALISNSSGKVAVSTTTSTELGYVHGVTSAIQTQLNGKQAKIGAGTANNIVAYSGTAGTLNTLTRTTSVRAKASASDTYIPTEKAVATSLEGKYDASNPAGYTSNVGTVTSVNNVSPVNGNVTLSIPSTDNLANKDLSNLSTTGNSKFQAPLVSGTNIKTVNNQSLLGSGNISIQADPAIDSKSITKNTSDQLQTVGVIDQNSTSTALKQWSGTKAQYDSIATKDANTLYNITDDSNTFQNVLETIYPVGSIYIGTMSVCPLSALFGTWALVAQDKVLQGAGTRGSVGSTLNESLPNIVAGNLLHSDSADGTISGAIETTRSTDSNEAKFPNSNRSYATTGVRINASIGSSTYQDNAPVQPDAYLVNIWQRTA